MLELESGPAQQDRIIHMEGQNKMEEAGADQSS